jgi:hypothetical protein
MQWLKRGKSMVSSSGPSMKKRNKRPLLMAPLISTNSREISNLAFLELLVYLYVILLVGRSR